MRLFSFASGVTSSRTPQFILKHIQYPRIQLSDDLSQLTLHTHNVASHMVNALSKKIQSDVVLGSSVDVERKNKVDTVNVTGLLDINIALRKSAEQLAKHDPQFFMNLEQLEYECENDDGTSADRSVLDIISSPYSVQYLMLQDLKMQGMQHTVEAPLKILKTQKIITQDEWLELIKHVWCATSALRRNEKSKPLTTEQENLFVPYSFRNS